MADWSPATCVMNSLTLLPVTEIYPTPAQLPPYVISSPHDIDNMPRNNPWPLSLRGELGVYSTGKDIDHRTILKCAPSSSPNYSHNQGYLLANYLAGTNASGRPISWPAFPGSSTQGFAGKYTPRQLDSIVAQILSIGSKAISSDYPYISGNVGEQIGHRYMVAPYVFPGWLSRQWVIGVGRSPEGYSNVYAKSRRFLRILQCNLGPGKSFNIHPAFATMDIWLEWWLPAGYFGGRKVLDPQFSSFFVGHRNAKEL